MVTMGMELSQRADCHPLDAAARAAGGGWPMIKEFIEREAALSAIKQAFEKGERPSLYIKSIPAADVAPVVRCKDCRWRGREDCAMFYRCDCGEQHTWETDNDFCSYGEQ